MKAVVVGCKLNPYNFKDDTGRQVSGTSSEIAVVKGKASGSAGYFGLEVETYKADEQVTNDVWKALESARAPVVFNFDMDDKGKGENKKVILSEGDFLGVLGVDFELSPSGLSPKGGAAGAPGAPGGPGGVVPAPRAPQAPRGAPAPAGASA